MAAPTILSSQFSTSATSDSTGFTPTMPTVTVGKLLVALIAADGNPTINPDNTSFGNGWRYRNGGMNGTAVTGVFLYKARAEGGSADNLTITASNAQQYSGWVACINAGNFPNLLCVDSNGSSTNSNPPSANWGVSKEVLIIAARMGDAAVVATAAPSGYSGLASQAGGASGASISIATKTETDDDEDPGAFTSATEQWVAMTLAIWAENGTKWARDDAGGIIFSNNDVTVEMAPGIFEQGVRGTIPHKTGKWGFNVSLGPTTWASYGFVDGSGFMDLLSFDWLARYSDREAIEGRWSVGTEIDTEEQAGFPEPEEDDTVYLLIDLNAGLFWFKVNNGDWNFTSGADPDAGTGGIDTSDTLPIGSEYVWPLFYGDEISELTADFSATALSGLSDATSFKYWDYVAPSGYTLAANAGTFAFSGGIAALRVARKILAAVGSFALAGANAVFNIASMGRTLVAGGGTFVMTGSAAALRIARKLVAAQSSYTAAGNAALLRASRRMQAASRAFTVTSFAAALRVARRLVAAVGGAAVAGGTAAFLRGRVLRAAAGLVAVTGNAAALRAVRIWVASAGTFAATGAAATLFRGRILVAGAGAFIIAGFVAALKRAAILRGAGGAYAVTGHGAEFPVKQPFQWEPAPAITETWTEPVADSTIWENQSSGASPWDEM